MSVAVIGAGRSRNGIGPFIAKYFHQNGLPVTAVLGRSASSAAAAADALAQYGIQAQGFDSFAELVERARPTAAVIAAPTAVHAALIEQCLAAGLHIFCDKPLVSPDTPRLTAFLMKALSTATAAGLRLGMNSQWPFVLPYYEELCGALAPEGVSTFAMRLSPMVQGRAMIPDSLPHALSVLYSALGNGTIEHLTIRPTPDGMVVAFTYRTDRTACAATVTLVRELTQPRTFAFGFDDRVAKRVITPATYAQALEYDGKRLVIPDPLGLSVKDFIRALADGQPPRIGSDHIVRTTILLQQIYDAAINLEG